MGKKPNLQEQTDVLRGNDRAEILELISKSSLLPEAEVYLLKNSARDVVVFYLGHYYLSPAAEVALFEKKDSALIELYLEGFTQFLCDEAEVLFVQWAKVERPAYLVKYEEAFGFCEKAQEIVSAVS